MERSPPGFFSQERREEMGSEGDNEQTGMAEEKVVKKDTWKVGVIGVKLQ